MWEGNFTDNSWGDTDRNAWTTLFEPPIKKMPEKCGPTVGPGGRGTDGEYVQADGIRRYTHAKVRKVQTEDGVTWAGVGEKDGRERAWFVPEKKFGEFIIRGSREKILK